MTYNLSRFLEAQRNDYTTALTEIKSGHKRSHWIWYIFPQLKGLGMSYMSDFYGLDGLGEAKAYLANDTLKARLLEISRALLALPENDATSVMGYPDDMKLHSSMTIFHLAAPDEPVFQKVLDKYFAGKLDKNTVRLCQLS
ncbi:DUF1810 domain-containing protein [uncultured Mitsuokella sp.]|uniref:DUF1810 domain-containing protein n=1 Tax=uncultured Mitsuokella sp. TaxID=453120 RepID=UPI00266FB2E1|nr:DUF1810 domain-containing protein [uncultured Mitsuokella sp.]